MKLMSILICVTSLAGMVSAQGFVPQFISQPQTPLLHNGGSRRQLTPVQQTHILSDIQQHQHRFSSQNQLFNPGTKNFGQKLSPNIVVEPSVQAHLSSETTVVQLPSQQNQFYLNQAQQQPLASRFRQPNNLRPGEQHVQHHTQTNFVPNFAGQPNQNVVFPQQPLFDRNLHQQQLPHQQQQQVFQRSVANQQGDAHIFKPSQPFPVAPPQLPNLLPTSSNAEQYHQNSFGQQQQQSQHHQQQQAVQTLQQNHVFQNQYQQGNGQFVQNQAAPQTPVNNLIPPLQPHQYQQFQNQQVKFGQPQQSPSNVPFFSEARPDDPRLKEILEKQKIIQKHEQFVQRQYEKHQQKVRQLHQEFVQKQRRIKEQSIVNSKNRAIPNFFPPQNRGRLVSPYEADTFERAVKNYQDAFPTQPTTTTIPITESFASATTIRAKSSRSNLKGDISEDELERLLTTHREKLFNQLKQDADKTPKKTKVKPTKAYGREDLLKQLKLALADQPADLGGQNYTTMDLVLPDGQKVQVIRTTDPNLVKGATPLNEDGSILSEVSPQELASSNQETISEQKPLFDEVAESGILPPGSNFEVIRQSANGDLQSVGSLPSKKKVTFVYLEEQTDGSYKVQGVKANGEKEAKTKGAEVENIINRINKGEIQLPPSTIPKQTTVASSAPTRSTSRVSSTSLLPSTTYVSNTQFASSSPTTQFISSATPAPSFTFPSSASPYSTLSTSSSDYTNGLTASPSSHYPSSTTPRSLPSRSIYTTRTLSTTYSGNNVPSASQPALSASTISQVHTPSTPSPIDSNTAQSELATILKDSGLHAMAKYLKQSGLDAILNETGPYTVFAPSDKAFKSLLVQLGGPDRAEEKFKSNPRLLSGLLLHHVIPGRFEIASLQDEMTGVSLAGTQLRVNQYNMHDTEWNDVKITTINGAMVLPDKKDVSIPQGIAHSVDRVMFPLPVGDILQTLQSDRERRFTNFLRALFASGLSELLQNKDPSNAKTYTVFAPTDLAFSNHTQEEINFMVTDKEAAHKLVMRHITPGTLFSSGMRFYQVRDSLQAGNAITLQKTNGGKIKVNESQMLTSNIPATNGVIHAIDSLL